MCRDPAGVCLTRGRPRYDDLPSGTLSHLVREYCDNLMIVLTLNSGSTSVKLGVYDTAASDAQPARLENAHYSGGDMEPQRLLSEFLGKLRLPPNVVAHRVVHGGTRFPGPARVDDAVVGDIKG